MADNTQNGAPLAAMPPLDESPEEEVDLDDREPTDEELTELVGLDAPALTDEELEAILEDEEY
jgi:hypothetical protein